MKKAQTIEQRVTLISKRLDKYGIEAIASFIPAIWDTAMAIITTSYLIIEWYTIWLSLKDCLKILWYQILDAAIWSIPLAWDLVDFLFKSNKYSAKIFSKHLEKLKKAAKEKWISQEQIDNIWKRETKFIKAMDKYTKY